MQLIQRVSAIGPGADPDQRLRLVLPSVLDDPDRFVRVEVFLALGAVFLQYLLINIHPKTWFGGDFRMSVLYLPLVLD